MLHFFSYFYDCNSLFPPQQFFLIRNIVVAGPFYNHFKKLLQYVICLLLSHFICYFEGGKHKKSLSAFPKRYQRTGVGMQWSFRKRTMGR